ncbi:MAG: Jag N-terminal domain-containing protein [Clostridia bacterium]|nr:Jag N-terminal domain-containing protein [Clostridia bacterium]
MKSIEASGKTVKDAIRNGLAELGCDSDDVDIQVIEMGSPGLFGMFGKPAKVRLTMKADDPALDIEMPVLSLDAGKGKPKPEKRRAEKPKAEKPAEQKSVEPKAESAQAESVEAASEDESRPEKKSRNRRRRRGGANRSEEGEREARESGEEEAIGQPAPVLEHEPFEPTPEENQTEDARRARDFLAGLTERMGVPVEIALMETPEQLRMQMTGEGMSLLIGRRGETLDALQYLTSLNINRGREEYLRVSIDTENYRAKREEALRKLAVRMAGRAKKSGRRVALEPMNPYERRILHSALQNDPDVTTHSEGEEPYRRVIITLK